MSQYNQSSKNPPWVRSGQNLAQNAGSVAQNLMAGALPMANAASVLQYPQVFQGQLQQQMYGNMGAVQYPTRAVNSAAFQNNSNMSSGNQGNVNNQNIGNSGNSNSSNPSNKNQRVFTGTVTKLQGTFGFVNDDIFFQTSCCVKGSDPQVGDRVLVEAIYNANMPFKWNASRLQVLSSIDQGNRFNSSSGGYNAVPPPPNEGSGGNSRFNSGGGGGGGSRFSNNDRSGSGNRNNDRNNRNRNQRPLGPKQDNNDDRKRKREDDRSDRSLDRERDREKQRSPPKRKSKSPPTRRQRQAPRRPPPRYTIVVPKSRLGSLEADLMHLTKRYQNLYVPSDFCMSQAKWVESFPIRSPLSLNFPCNFFVMHKDVDSPYTNDAVLEPSDADYRYVAKVMLLSSPGLEDLLIKTGISYDPEGCKDESDDESISSGSGSVTHMSRLVHFLVGTRGKEPMAIGGPWSPSLDGANPESDPGVLVQTAIRTCKALTGIDLSACTQWFRFLEVHYHRAESVHHGKTVPARIETVVLFVPDVWSASPNRIDWEKITSDYKMALENRLNPRAPTPDTSSTTSDAANKQKDADEKDADTTKEEEAFESPEKSDLPKKDPSHYSLLDPKSMKVSELRDELETRNLSPKGLKSQLVARLAKAIKTEADEEEANGNVKDDPSAATLEDTSEKPTAEEQPPSSPTSATPAKKDEDKKKEDDKDKQKEKKKEELSEKDKIQLEKRYRLPENPHIIVHPHRAHKAGKYDCAVTSLSSLLGYRIEDSKEHSFEVSLFAEAFNEMLMRDFGFVVYKSIIDAPEKVKEEKKDNDKDKDKKKDKDTKDKDKPKEDDKDEKDDKDKKEDEPVENEEEEQKKKEDKRPRVVDNNILLAYSYFDTTRCGYIYDKDLNDLLYCLGIALSRSQVKKLVQKVSVRDSVHYKKLAEKVKPDEVEDEPMETNQDELWEDIITGNRKLLPQKKTEPTSSPKKKGAKGSDSLNSGFVMHNGTLVDVGKLLGQLNRSDTTKMETERALAKVKAELAKLKETHSKSERNIKDLQSDIRNYKDKLNSAFSDLNSAQANERSYFRIISDIHHKVGPVLKRKEEEEEARRAKKAADAEVMEIVELTDDDKKEDVKTETESKNDIKEEETKIAVESQEKDIKIEPTKK